VKRIIFSIYNDNVDQNHKSTDSYKLSQFRKYEKPLIDCKKQYAEKYGADFVLHRTETTDYNSIQFEKIILLENYAGLYDEIVYLDFDVVPTGYAPNIFKNIDFETLGVYPLRRDLTRGLIKERLDADALDNQNVFCKTCAKKAMLLIEGINGNDLLYNTGVVSGGSKIIKELNFVDQLPELHALLDEAREDSLYPEGITKNFYYNNEVYISYLIEKEEIPHTDLSISWNFILDGYQRRPTAAGYFIHHVNKEFELSL